MERIIARNEDIQKAIASLKDFETAINLIPYEYINSAMTSFFQLSEVTRILFAIAESVKSICSEEIMDYTLRQAINIEDNMINIVRDIQMEPIQMYSRNISLNIIVQMLLLDSLKQMETKRGELNITDYPFSSEENDIIDKFSEDIRKKEYSKNTVKDIFIYLKGVSALLFDEKQTSTTYEMCVCNYIGTSVINRINNLKQYILEELAMNKRNIVSAYIPIMPIINIREAPIALKINTPPIITIEQNISGDRFLIAGYTLKNNILKGKVLQQAYASLELAKLQITEWFIVREISEINNIAFNKATKLLIDAIDPNNLSEIYEKEKNQIDIQKESETLTDIYHNTRINALKEAISSNNNNFKYYMNQAQIIHENLKADNITLSALINNKTNTDALNESLQLIKDNKYTKYINIKDNTLSIMTKYLYITEPKTNKMFECGEMVIVISLNTCNNMDNSPIKIFNITQLRYGYAEGMQHPHVFNNGEPCWGTLNSLVANYFAEQEYYALYTSILNYLQTCSIEDEAGRYVYAWDEVDPNTLEIIQYGSREVANEMCPEFTCAICGEYMTEDELYVCEDCDNNMCSEHAYLINDDYWVCENCYEESYRTCTICHTPQHEDDMHRVYFQGNTESIVCESCFDTEFLKCEHCNNYVHEDYINLHNGRLICDWCFENEEIESEEETETETETENTIF